MAFINGDAVLDDEWKRMQEKTFTRWCNEQVKVNDISIDNLAEDFSDGKKLIALIEVLSEKRIGRYNKNCKLRAQKMENVQQTLDFLLKEKVKIVNIRSNDIVDGNMKLILGLIWTLILHYQISVGFNDSGLTPKQALLKWLQAKLKDRPVGPPKNLTSDWIDGRRLAALCDEIAPGLFPDADTLNSADATENVREAIDQANEYLNVPKLMNSEDIANPKIDEKSMMTYLSEFIDANLVKPLEEIEGVKVYGPGVEPEVKTGEPINFTIDSSEIGINRNPRIKITDPENCSIPAKLEQIGDGKYTCTYAPEKIGEHKINVTLGRPVRNSPFTVSAVPGSGGGNNISKIKVYGKGVESNQLEIHTPTSFVVETQDLEGDLKLVIDGPDGILTSEEITIKDGGEGKYDVEYMPRYPGKYNVDILFDNERVAESPYSVLALPLYKPDASKVKVTGKGIEKGRVDEPLTFCIDTRCAGHGNIDMSLEGPSKCDTTYDDNQNGTCNVSYVPLKAGEYKIALKFDDKEVANSPFKVSVYDPTKVVATGPGIDGVGAKNNSPANVMLDTTEAGDGLFQCSFTGPDGTKEFEVKATGEFGALQGNYIPTKTGEYTVSIKMEGEEIPNSPFLLAIGDPDSLKLSGPALQYAYVDEPTEVCIDTSGAGKSQVTAQLKDPEGRNVPTNVVQAKDSEVKVKFTPRIGGTHKLDLNHSGFPLTCEIKVLDPEKIKAYGLGLESKGNFVGKETEFFVETGGLGIEDLIVPIQCRQSQVNPKIKEIKRDTFQVSYTPEHPQVHDVVIKLADVEVCKSPYQVGVCDPMKIHAYGDGLKKGVENSESEFFIEVTDAGEGALEIFVEGPEKTEVVCNRKSDDLLKVVYTPKKAGLYDVNITFGDGPIAASPFHIRVLRSPPDASKCVPFGINQPGGFQIDASNAGGNGMLEVGVCGAHTPSDYVTVKHNGDYIFDVAYSIPEPGESEITVKWHGEHIKGSPFTIITEDDNN